MFKIIVICTLMLAAEANQQNKQYLTALNEAVASYLAGPPVSSSVNSGAVSTPLPLEPVSLLPAQSSNYQSMLSSGIPEYIQTAPSYHQNSGGAQVSAAVHTKRTVEVKPIMMQSEPVEPHIVDVEASYQPVQVVFRSSSSPVMVQQIHTPAQPIQVEPTQSEDEPHRVQHQVMRPVIQEIREIIQPYRRVLQEIRPVLEEVRTIVAKAEGAQAQGGPLGGGGGGAGAGGGGGGGAGGYGPGAGILLGGGDAYGGRPMRKSYSRRSALAPPRRQYSDRARS